MTPSHDRLAESIRLTIKNTIDYFKPSNCLYITLTLKKSSSSSLRGLLTKTQKACDLLKKVFPHQIAVLGTRDDPDHVHILAIREDLPTFIKSHGIPQLRGVIRSARLKAGFGPILKFIPLTVDTDPLSLYMAKDYSRTRQWKRTLPSSGRRRARLVVYRGIKPHLKVTPFRFSRNGPRAKVYRAALNALARLCGTPIDDVPALSRALDLSFDEIRNRIFEIINHTPMRMPKTTTGASSINFPQAILRERFSLPPTVNMVVSQNAVAGAFVRNLEAIEEAPTIPLTDRSSDASLPYSTSPPPVAA